MGSEGNMTVQLLTDDLSGKYSGPGGVCKVKCLKGSTSPTPTPPQQGENVLERISLEDYPLAQCNDLSPAVYYRYLTLRLSPMLLRFFSTELGLKALQVNASQRH